MIPFLAKAGWAICTRAGLRYVPKTWRTAALAQAVLDDLLAYHAPTSKWRTLRVELRDREVFEDVPEVP